MKHRKRKIEITCQVCGKTFQDYISNKRKYCCRRCFEIAEKGTKRTEGVRKKMSGRIPWNKGKKGVYSKEVLEKMRIARIGKPPINKGMPVPKEICKKISEACRGIKKPNLAKIMKGRIHEKANHWKGGKTIHQMGYIQIKNRRHPNRDHQGYVMEHRLIMEKNLGRYLKTEEVVHHIDGNVSNNKIENLILFANNIEHLNYHKKNKENKSCQ